MFCNDGWQALHHGAAQRQAYVELYKKCTF